MNDAPNTPQNLVQAWQFGVEIDGWTAAYFTRATLPEIEFEESTFSPAGSMFDHKVPGRATFADVTLTLGTRADSVPDEAIAWLTKQIDVLSQTGLAVEDVLDDIAIVQYSRPGEQVRRWTLHGAWIKSYSPGEHDGSSSDNIMREVVIAYQYYEVE